MPQSYKTNKRAARPLNIRKGLLAIGLVCVLAGAVRGLQTTTGKRSTQFLAHVTYRFQVPGKLASELWQHLEKTYAAALPATEDQTTDFYFDDEARTLQNQQIMLRHRLVFSRDGRKERIQLIFPASGSAQIGREIVFRHNRKPDKGPGFTTHPLLKLLRNKDRPVLDSLLQPLGISAENLQPVLEITETRRQLNLQKHQSDWLVLTLTQLRSAAPEYAYWELQLHPDPKQLTFASEEVKKELLFETRELSQNLQKQFPELQRQTETEYDYMQEMRSQPSPAQNRTKALFGLVLLIGLFLFHKFRKEKRT